MISALHAAEHIHLWTRSVDGVEFGNAIYGDDSDAAMAFLGIVRDVTKYSPDAKVINIELVMESLTEGRGMWAGSPGFLVVLLRCEGGCRPPSWN